MPIKFQCPHCQKSLTVKDHLAGKRAPCPACQKVFTIPSPAAAPAPAPAAPAPRPASVPTPAPAPAPSEAELEDFAASMLTDEPIKKEQEAPRFIEFECEQCLEPVKMDVALAGKRTPCPHCKRVIKVPLVKQDKPKDWRSTSDGLPTGAKREKEELAGAWEAAKIVARESLEEAGALSSQQGEPTSRKTWIVRGLVATAALILVVVGVTAVVNAISGSRQEKLMTKALDGAEKLAGPEKAVVHLAAGTYYLRKNEPDCVKDPKKKQRGAWDQFALARTALGGNQMPAEADWLLIELGLAQVGLGGSNDEVEKRTRFTWEQTSRELVQTIRAIRQPEARVEAVQQIARKLIGAGQPQIVSAMVRQFSEQPDMLAVAGLELIRAGQAEQARELHQAILNLYSQPVPEGQTPLPPTLEVVALGHALNEKGLPVRPEYKEVFAGGRVAGLFWRKESGQLDRSASLFSKLETYLCAAAMQGEDRRPLQDALGALQLIPADRGVNGWQVLRLVNLAAQADEAEAKILAALRRIREPAMLYPAGQLLLFRVQVRQAKDKLPADLLNSVDPNSLCHAQARLEWARHNVRHNSGTIKEVEGWDEKWRPFGLAGCVLGLQGKD